MKPFIEKLSHPEDYSFLIETYTTPHFNTPWHQHVEYELILFLRGSGYSYIGNYIGRFEVNDIFFLGSNLPHTFQEVNDGSVTSAIVIQFKEDFWGKDFLTIPECASLKKLLHTSYQGLKIKEDSKKILRHLVKTLLVSQGFKRITTFCQLLLLLVETRPFDTLSTVEVKEFNSKDKQKIDYIFQYIVENYRDNIHLPDIAKMAGMSVPAFCNYFKKRTKKTFINYVNELRVGNACKLLTDSQKTISEICYESGYNSVANFNKQFLKIKGEAPSMYKKNSFTREL